MHIPFCLRDIILDFFTNRGKKGFPGLKQVLLINADIPIEQKEELPLHQIDVFEIEPKTVVAPDTGIPGPIDVPRT